ncbi:hypothetical protein ACJX0J_013323, partial [Zea mays]
WNILCVCLFPQQLWLMKYFIFSFSFQGQIYITMFTMISSYFKTFFKSILALLKTNLNEGDPTTGMLIPINLPNADPLVFRLLTILCSLLLKYYPIKPVTWFASAFIHILVGTSGMAYMGTSLDQIF